MRAPASFALVLGLLFAAPGTAFAQFPSCIAEVDNPALQPNEDGSYPADPANAYDGPHTVWSTDRLAIKVSVDSGSATQFIAEGMNYQPTQIGGSADFPPFQDFFYENDVSTWNPLWRRDIGAMRAIGVNSIRVYATWKWEPGSTVIQNDDSIDPQKSRASQPYWKKLNFAAGSGPAQENNKQFCITNTDRKKNLIFQHATHIPFLDQLWNNGQKPIYMWIGIGLDKSLINGDVPQEVRRDLLQYYRYTAKWLAKKYGNHPGVIGFVIGNELAGEPLMAKSLFWETVNDLNAVIKASAPDKLTMVTFHDGPSYNVAITEGRYAGLRGPQVYDLDVWGFNPYNNPGRPGNLFSRYRADVVENCTTPDGTPCVKPLLYGEFGVPASTHKATSDLDKLYPVRWTAPNFLFMQNPPPSQCLTSSELGPPPGSGSDGERAEFEKRESVAVEMAANTGGRVYRMPGDLVAEFPGSGVKSGDPLRAAFQADFIREFWDVTLAHLADNSAPSSEEKFSSGGYLFEWRDEWWKGKNVDGSDGPMWFHSATGKQVCSNAQRCGRSSECRTGAANDAFPGGWDDEQWFGVTDAKTDGRKDKDDVIKANTGKLNGGPDILRPRAAIVAICEAFNGPGCR